MRLMPRRLRALAPRFMLWSLRVLSTIFLISAVVHWATILGIDTGAEGFASLLPQQQFAHGYLALIEVIAAVGLWFGAGWGVATWLLAAVSELVMHLGFPETYGDGLATITFHVVTILGYFVLAWWCGAPENTGELLRLPPD